VKNEISEIKIPIITAGKKIFLYERPDESITRISLSDVSLPTVMSVPTREANGADMAITEGREKRINNATCENGTCLVSTSFAIRSIWFTKKIKKKKRNEMKNENKASDNI
jgi:hypothetical protein